jgi:hypothetical protein
MLKGAIHPPIPLRYIITLSYTITLHFHFYYRSFSTSPLDYPTRLSVAVLRHNVSNNRKGK